MASTSSLNENVTSHTPGPWEVNADGHVIATQFKQLVPVLDKNGVTHLHDRGLVALVYSPGDGPLRFDANASLIAAAPDLLAVLKTILDGFEQGIFVRDVTQDGNSDWSTRLVPFIAVLQRAQAAIAKAEGAR